MNGPKKWHVISGQAQGQSMNSKELQEALNSGKLDDAKITRDGSDGKYKRDDYCGRPTLVLEIEE